jgi:hypothetical protein
MNKNRKSLSKLSKLEHAWNPNVQLPQESKRLNQMSSDIKTFLIKSIAEHEGTAQSRYGKSSSVDPVDGISTILGFRHHIGTDVNLELKIVKIILVREGLLMSLKHLHEKTLRTNNIEKTCTNILELLAQIRECTLNYLEALCLWRQSSRQDGKQQHPQLFFWEKKNYTLKLVSDLDFLAQNGAIVDALNLPPFQLMSNPLMLTNNLEDTSTWMDPFERARLDTDGLTEGPQFDSRLRLRFAERIILQEIETSNSAGMSESPWPMEQQRNSADDFSYNREYLVKGSKALSDFDEERYSNQG